MSSIAENINNIIRESTCEVIIHPGVTCRQNVIDQFMPMLWNNAKFFVPIIFIPYLLKFRQFDEKMAKEALRNYAGAIFSGLSIGYTTSASLCTLKRWLSNYENGLFVKVAALIGGHWIFMLPKKVVHLFCIAVFQTSLETVIRSRGNFATNALFKSRYILQTLVFMTTSCAILQSLQKVNHKVFWFTYPVNKPKSDLCSTHKGKCVRHCVQLMLKNLMIGMALDIFKHLSSMKKNSRINFSMASFLVAYSGIYRILICVLNKYFYEHFDELHAVAAFLSGIAYIFAPRTTLLAYGMVISVEVVWKVLETKYKNHKDLKKLLEVPYHKIMLPFALSFLVHSYVFNRKAVSSFGTKFINGVTNNKAMEIYQRLLFLNALPA